MLRFFSRAAITILMRITPIIGVTYLLLYYVIPSASNLKNKRTLLLWIVFIVVAVGLGMRLYNFYIIYPLFDIKPPGDSNLWDLRFALNYLFSYMAIICMAVVIKLAKGKTALEQSNYQLQKEKKEAELNFLRAQMQPHFLFNTLNTLFSEVIKDSVKAQEVVLHLSSLLRFILDECNKPAIPLAMELKVIQDFVALEKLRHGKRLHVTINIQDSVKEDMMIPPLIFLPFVENSFKHTLANQLGSIHIDITVDMYGDHLYLIVENDDLTPHDMKPKPGKGYRNITNQLNLLFGKNYSLSVNGAKDKYRVSLKIPIKQEINYE